MTARRKIAVVGAAFAMALGLAGCGAGQDIADLMGNVSGSDITPVKGALLTIPPDYDLRPPRGGSDSSKAAEASRRARTAMVGSSVGRVAGPAGEAGGRSAGEAALLRQASNGQSVDSSIRPRVNAETEVDKEDERAFVDKLVKYRDSEDSEDSGSGVSANPKPTIKRQGEIF